MIDRPNGAKITLSGAGSTIAEGGSPAIRTYQVEHPIIFYLTMTTGWAHITRLQYNCRCELALAVVGLLKKMVQLKGEILTKLAAHMTLDAGSLHWLHYNKTGGVIIFPTVVGLLSDPTLEILDYE